MTKLDALKPTHPRPYWHVDAKWICGLIFAAALTSTLLLASLWRLTSPAVAIPTSTEFVASLFSHNNLDDPTDIEALKRQAATTPGETIQPLEGQTATITKQELYTLSPRQLRLKVYRQIIEPYYTRGVEAVAAEAPTPEKRDQIKRQAGPLAFINHRTHEQLGRAALAAAVVTFLALVGLVLFSYRWGKLASPGLVALLCSAPAALFLLAVSSAAGHGGGPSSQLSPQTTQQLAQLLLGPYRATALIGLILLLAAAIGRVITKKSQQNTLGA